MSAKKKAAGSGKRKPAAKAPTGAPSKKTKSRKDRSFSAGSDRAVSNFESVSTATDVQLQKLVARLSMRPHHTHELRACGISHPAGRVRDLIERGYAITSDRVVTVDSDSFIHRNVALYSLVIKPPQLDLFGHEAGAAGKGPKE